MSTVTLLQNNTHFRFFYVQYGKMLFVLEYAIKALLTLALYLDMSRYHYKQVTLPLKMRRAEISTETNKRNLAE
jgi:hypothetical protein